MVREDISKKKNTNNYRSVTQHIPYAGVISIFPGGFTLSGVAEKAFEGYRQKMVIDTDQPVYFKLLSFPEIDTLIPESDLFSKHTDLEHSKAHVVPR